MLTDAKIKAAKSRDKAYKLTHKARIEVALYVLSLEATSHIVDIRQFSHSVPNPIHLPLYPCLLHST